jgi:uncharacterized alpha/beta hydrolase family protein
MMPNRHAISLAAVLSAILLLTGCGYVKMSFKKAHAERWQSLRARKAAYPERNFIVAGQLRIEQDRPAPLAVVAVSDDLRENEIVDMFMVNAPSQYSLYLPPGNYELMVFADINGNRRFESGEVAGRFGNNGSLLLAGDKGGVLTGIDIDLDLKNPSHSDFRFHKRVRRGLTNLNLKEVTKELEDPIFSQKVGTLGLYDPANFMRKVPSMLYTVKGDTSKLPVVFVHGIEGTPSNWEYLSKRLDREKFHPWFFYYPSGESLEKSAEVLYRLLEETFPFEPVVLVAHSMGGLVARAALEMYGAERRSDYISMFISLNTPYGGVQSARAAVNNPVSAPSWLDIAPSSDFILQYVHNGNIPKHISFYLIFAYGNEGITRECSDGSISLQSQLEPHVQSQARSVFGFEETHGGVLRNRDVSDRINALLNSIGPAAPKGASSSNVFRQPQSAISG